MMDAEQEPILSKDVEQIKCCHGKCYTQSRFYRYTLMLFVSVVGVGDYFCYDNPAALEDHMLKDLGLTESRYMIFYSALQWIQIGACLFGGYLVDRVLGIRASIVLAATVLTMAQSLFAGGAMMNSYWTMVVARMIYGAMNGIEWLSINKMNAKWFKDKELTFVIGLKVCLARWGTVANMNLMDPFYSLFNKHFHNLFSLGLTLFVGAGVCSVAACCSCVVFYMDKKAETCSEQTRPSETKGIVGRKSLTNFPVTFWLVAVELPSYLLVIFTFTGLGQVFLERKYGYNLGTASNINSFVYLIGACAMPVLGLIIDKTGRNLYWMFAGLILQLACHLLLTFTFVNPYVAMSLLGASYSFMSLGTWPLIPYIVKLDNLGVAYGIVCCFIALGETGSTYVAGYLAENHGYISMETLMLTLSCVAFILGSLLFIIDKANGGNLNLNQADRVLYDDKHTEKTE